MSTIYLLSDWILQAAPSEASSNTPHATKTEDGTMKRKYTPESPITPTLDNPLSTNEAPRGYESLASTDRVQPSSSGTVNPPTLAKPTTKRQRMTRRQDTGCCESLLFIFVIMFLFSVLFHLLITTHLQCHMFYFIK